MMLNLLALIYVATVALSLALVLGVANFTTSEMTIIIEATPVLAPHDDVITDLVNRDLKLDRQRAAFVRGVRWSGKNITPEANDALGGVYLRRTENHEYVFDVVQ